MAIAVLQSTTANRRFFNLTNTMPNLAAEKSTSFPPEAPQQEPGEVLVPVFHTRPYHAVPECVTLVQRETFLAGRLPSHWPQRCSDVGNLG